MAYLRTFLMEAILFWRRVVRLDSSAVRRRRMARVFFTRKSKGMYFLPAKAVFSVSRSLWLMTVKTRAMALRTLRL